jgi:hypothetical protein
MVVKPKLDWILVGAIVTALAPIALPLAGFMIAGACGCRVHEGDIVPCPVLGLDIGPLLTYMVVSWTCGCCLTPLGALIALIRALMLFVGPS